MVQNICEIKFESLVSADSLEPTVELRWGKQQTQYSTSQARMLALALLEVTATAEIDAKLVKWAINRLALSPSEAAGLLLAFRQMRESDPKINVAISLDNELVTPNTGKQSALDMLMLVAAAEVEAMLAHFLIEKLQRSPEVTEEIVNEFRAIL